MTEDQAEMPELSGRQNGKTMASFLAALDEAMNAEGIPGYRRQRVLNRLTYGHPAAPQRQRNPHCTADTGQVFINAPQHMTVRQFLRVISEHDEGGRADSQP